MKKGLKISLVIVIGLFLALLSLYTFLKFWPSKVEISLPFLANEDSITGLIPMGEIEQWHNASNGLPNGHPGIDFQWNREVEILAVGNGRIIAIYKNDEDKFIVEQSLGLFYRTTYQELNSLSPETKIFSKVKKGQVLGYSGFHRTEFKEPPKPSDPSGQIHWDFAKMVEFRTCPYGYFDSESKARIDTIWSRVKAKGEYKPEYPDICNGAYKETK